MSRTIEQTPTTSDEPPPAERLTIEQAADLLNEDRSYLIKLLDAGDIACVGKGSHRSLRLDDLLSYKQKRDAIRRQALLDLTRISQEMGLDEMDYEAYLAEILSDAS